MQKRRAYMEVVAADSGSIALLDGATIQYRPIRSSDREALQRFHSRNSDESNYLRFFYVQRALSDVQARHFTELDGMNRFALVALDPIDLNEIIGVARFDREPGTERAEYAAIIADAWQGHGLGLQLTKRLIEAAKRRGITTFYAFVLPENLRMLNLLIDLGLPETVRYENDVECIDVGLSRGEGNTEAFHASDPLDASPPASETEN
jgi:RimJ/RimL family protein N-acetyltransferase